ncbi:MAG TPA: hypothetical protein VN673_14430 [Clostridia bacterium]|nr:hypothetical protein [Clostridia bacterium]
MLSPELLSVLCCPETGQELHLAAPELIEQLNRQLANAGLTTRGGCVQTARLQAGLVRADNRLLYPIRDGIPVLLVQEAISIPVPLA